MDDVAAAFAYYADLARAGPPPERAGAAAGRALRGCRPLRAGRRRGLIVPWNFPLVTTSWKVAPALAAGCTVVLKPSEVTPLVELELGAIADEVGLPPGVLNIVVGTGPDVGAPLGRAPGRRQDLVHRQQRRRRAGDGRRPPAAPRASASSSAASRRSWCSRTADIDHAVECITAGIFYNCGQMCSATSRLLVARAVAEPLLDRLVAAAEALQIGDALDPRVRMGPLTTAAQYRKVDWRDRAGRRGRACGCSPAAARPEGLERGYFVRADHLHRRPAGQRALARGDLRAGAGGPDLREESEAISSPTTATSAWSRRSSRAIASARSASRPRSRPATSGSTARRSCSSRPPGAASSAAASAASSAPGASRPSSRSSTSSARRGPEHGRARRETTSGGNADRRAVGDQSGAAAREPRGRLDRRVEARMAEAQAAGAGLLVLPEFACAQWLSFAPPGLAARPAGPWLAALTEQALAGAAAAARPLRRRPARRAPCRSPIADAAMACPAISTAPGCCCRTGGLPPGQAVPHAERA